MRQLSKLWNGLDDDERAKYQDTADDDVAEDVDDDDDDDDADGAENGLTKNAGATQKKAMKRWMNLKAQEVSCPCETLQCAGNVVVRVLNVYCAF